MARLLHPLLILPQADLLLQGSPRPETGAQNAVLATSENRALRCITPRPDIDSCHWVAQAPRSMDTTHMPLVCLEDAQGPQLEVPSDTKLHISPRHSSAPLSHAALRSDHAYSHQGSHQLQT